MEPASADGAGSSGGNRNLKRWGPIVGVVAVVAIVIGVLAFTAGGDDDDDAVDTSAAPVDTATDTTSATTTGDSTVDTTGTTAPGGEVTYPLTYSQAVEQGVEGDIEWGERCDTTTGRVAVPDYFAPECYAPFEGDNGGATAQGVTADEITVVYYEAMESDPIIAYITDAVAVDDTNAQQFETMRGMLDYFEAYYETYGRKINLVTYEGTGIASDDVTARADAVKIAEQYQPFAVLGGPALTNAFADELAAREIMCIGCTPGQPEEFYVDRDPYVWGLATAAVQSQTHALEVLEKQLIGKNATHGGDAVVNQPRKFGLLYIESSTTSQELADRFASEMEALDAPFAEKVAYTLDPATIQQQASQVITKLKAAGVTTIVFTGDPVAPRDFSREATAQEYFPEWFFAQSALIDVTAFARTYDQQQWAHAFGVTGLAARGNPTTTGYYALYEWYHGSPPPADESIGVFVPNAALFMAIVEGTGPNLTAATWRDALFAFEGTTKAISQPYLSYGDKGYWGGVMDYQGVDDATLIWWDPTATGPDEIRKEGMGMYRWVDGGARYLPGEWPTEDKLFVQDGSVAIYETTPPGEEVPVYPSPAG